MVPRNLGRYKELPSNPWAGKDVKKVYDNPDESIDAIFINGKVLVTKACLDTLRKGCMEGVMVEERGKTGDRWFLEFID
jgi:hypothetical protein